MNQTERSHLLAEKGFLVQRLAAAPITARLMRAGLQSRLEGIERKLAEAPNQADPIKINLTFNGRPVLGSQGILAQFGADAVNKFTEAVDAVVASLSAPLNASGPIPNRGQQLLITNTAIGSFGFELEEYCVGPARLDLGESPVNQALQRVTNLLEGSIGTDDQLAESASETDPRALEKMRVFLETLAENDATMNLSFNERSFRFANIDQVKASAQRLSRDNIQETEVSLTGRFEGYLPSRRTFDFLIDGEAQVITGKAGPDLALDVLTRINDHLHRQTTVRMMRTQVGTGRPKYRLLRLDDWPTLNQ